MLMYAYDYVGMGSGPQKLICFALKARYEIMLLISFWTSLGIYILVGRGADMKFVNLYRLTPFKLNFRPN